MSDEHAERRRELDARALADYRQAVGDPNAEPPEEVVAGMRKVGDSLEKYWRLAGEAKQIEEGQS